MPSGNRRPARAKRLVKSYILTKKSHDKRLRHRKAQLRRIFKHINSVAGPNDATIAPSVISSLSSLSKMSDSQDGDDTSSSHSEGLLDEWDEIFGTEWRSKNFLATRYDTFNSSASHIDLDLENSLPDLADVDGSEDSSSVSTVGEDDFDSDMLDLDADDEFSDNSKSEDEDSQNQTARFLFPADKWSRLRKWVYTQIANMYTSRYEIPRDGLPRGPSYLHFVLVSLKTGRPDHFRQQLRINPTTFDALVTAIEQDPIFMNRSNNAQMPVEQQLAITLFRFGRDGNASGLQDVANWAGVAKGTVSLVSRRVMVAVLRPGFMEDAVKFPDNEEIEDAKEWVKNHSLRSWKNGWCFVDGTLVPLATRPEWFGESYWDRKDRYSLNVQVLFLILFLMAA